MHQLGCGERIELPQATCGRAERIIHYPHVSVLSVLQEHCQDLVCHTARLNAPPSRLEDVWRVRCMPGGRRTRGNCSRFHQCFRLRLRSQCASILALAAASSSGRLMIISAHDPDPAEDRPSASPGAPAPPGAGSTALPLYLSAGPLLLAGSPPAPWRCPSLLSPAGVSPNAPFAELRQAVRSHCCNCSKGRTAGHAGAA